MTVFHEFMLDVDNVLARILGVTSIDLSDFDYLSAYNDGVSPEETAERVLEASGFVKKEKQNG